MHTRTSVRPSRRESVSFEFRRWLFLLAGLLCSGVCLWQSGRVTLPTANATTQIALSAQSSLPPNVSAAADRQPQFKMKSVADFHEGDEILAYNTSTKQVEVRRVKHAFEKTGDHLRLLTLRTTDGNEQTIKTTNEHPFYRVWRNRPDAGEWVDAEQLAPGNKLRTPDGQLATLVETEYEPHPEGIAVYNVEVDELHSYFVTAHGARAPPVLSHNLDCTPDVIHKNGWRTRDGKIASPLDGRRPGEDAVNQVRSAINAKKGWKVLDGEVTVRNATGKGRRYDLIA